MAIRTSHLNKRSRRQQARNVDLDAEFEKLTQHHLRSFEEQLHNSAENMQKKIINELSHKLSEQLMSAFNGAGGGIASDVLGKTLQQTMSSIGSGLFK